MIDIRSRGLQWFECHYLPPFSRGFALSAAPEPCWGCGQGKTARKRRGGFLGVLPRVVPRHPPQPWAGLHNPFRIAGVRREPLW